MSARRVLPLALPALLLFPGPSAAEEAAGARFLPVRPGGPAGSLVLYDVEALRTSLRLPRGLRSADGRSFVAARVEGTRTILTRHLLPSGRVAARGSVPGRYALAAVSTRGRRVVLAAARTAPGRTRLAVAETSRWRVQRRVELIGSYGVEALSPDGRRLFLIRYLDGGYNLRVYDLRTGRLAFTPLAEGAAAREKMAGSGWTSVATRDGRWLLTLYVRAAGAAFVHVLDLRSALGHCVDLPAGFADAKSVRAASLALSPDEQRLYVAGPLPGRVLTVELAPPRVVRTVRFDGLDGSSELDGRGLAAASPGGATVAFAAGGWVWRYRAAAGAAGAPVRVGGRLAGLGFTPDGRRIVVVRRDESAAVLDAATGRRLR